MHKEQLAGLTALLRKTGFKDLEGSLLTRMSFRLPVFTIPYTIQSTDEIFLFQLCFAREDDHHYVFQHYDVQLQKIMNVETGSGSADIRALHKQMSKVDWVKFNSADTASNWDDASMVENICRQLERLEVTEEGKIIVNQLKVQHWWERVSEKLYSCLPASKQKNTISQRFYINEDHPISIDEACRFLQNKWTEQQMNVRRVKAAMEENEKDETAKAGKVKKKTGTGK